MTNDSIKPEHRLDPWHRAYRRKRNWRDWFNGAKWGTLLGMFLMFAAFHVGMWVDGSHTFKDWSPIAYSAMFGWLKKLQ